MVSLSAGVSHPQTTQDGDVVPSHDGLGLLLECMRSAWEGQEDAASCACRFLVGAGGAEQEQQLGRLLSFVEALRGPLLERLQAHQVHQEGHGTMEEAARKRVRCAAGNGQGDGRVEPEDRREAGAQDKTPSAFSSPSSGTAAAAPPLEPTQEGMSRAVKGVLLDQDLLACVWGFVLGGTGRQDVCVVGQLSLVCRKWRKVGSWDAWWGRIEEDMLPVLWDEVGGNTASSRGRVLEYGRFLEGERDPLEGQEREDDWLRGLEGHVEIFDRMDGFQMLSMKGPVWIYQETVEINMEFRADSPVTQVKGAAFSAASRDPLRRFLTMKEYLKEGHKEEYPCCLCIRVTVRDMRTGRMAVIWEDSNLHLEDRMPNNNGGWNVYMGRPQFQDNRFRRLLRTDGAWFKIHRVPDQGEGVNGQDVLYRIQPQGLRVDFKGICGEFNDEHLSLEQFHGTLLAVLG